MGYCFLLRFVLWIEFHRYPFGSLSVIGAGVSILLKTPRTSTWSQPLFVCSGVSTSTCFQQDLNPGGGYISLLLSLTRPRYSWHIFHFFLFLNFYFFVWYHPGALQRGWEKLTTIYPSGAIKHWRLHLEFFGLFPCLINQEASITSALRISLI